MKHIYYFLFSALALTGLCFQGHSQTNVETKPSIADLLRWQYEAITWGESTNGLQLGVARIASPTKKTPAKYSIEVYLCNTNQASLSGLVRAPEGHRLDVTLFDAQGKTVPRTIVGNAKCKSVGVITKAFLNQERNRTHGVLMLMTMTPMQYDSFDILDGFKIETAGTYKLVVHANLYKLAEFPDVEPIVLPEAVIKVSFSKADLDRLNSSKAKLQ